MFRASSAHLQEVNDVNCACMQPLVFSFSAGGRLVYLLSKYQVGINKGINLYSCILLVASIIISRCTDS